mmetsp:Transcript_10407/g.20649  ORF Transcript_10407/g.20649 Transcript_10407/m.20649 type:complete len:183 (-) Transcript_10407:838-1386(-)
MESHIKTIQKQKSSLQQRCTDLEIKVEAHEIQFHETMQAMAKRTDGGIMLEQQRHQHNLEKLEKKLKRTVGIEQENRKLKDELAQLSKISRNASTSNSNEEIAKAWKHVENRDRIILAIKELLEEKFARVDVLEREKKALSDEISRLTKHSVGLVKLERKKFHQRQDAVEVHEVASTDHACR